MSSCFFIGHRDAPGSLLPLVKAAVENLILQEGVNDFYVGSRGNFDRLAATAVRELGEIYPHIRLYRVLAYLPTGRAELPEGFTGSVYPEGLESVPRRFAILRANRAMVDACQYLIAYAPHETGNARKVAEYAKQKGRRVIEVRDMKDAQASS